MKLLKIAGYSGLLLIILIFLNGLISSIMSLAGLGFFNVPFLAIIYCLILLILQIAFINGFIVLGRKTNSKFLIIMGWIGIALIIFLSLTGIYFMSSLKLPSEDVIVKNINILANLTESNQELPYEMIASNLDVDVMGVLLSLFIYFVFMYLFMSIVFGIYTILKGIALLKIKDKVPHAKTAGILDIISGATYFIFVGYVVQIAAYIVQIMMFFKASAKFEGKKR